MAEDLLLKVELRESVGSRDAGRVREQGRVPANIYGLGKDGQSVTICREDVEKLVATRSAVVDVDVAGTVDKAVVQELQWDVYSTKVLHVDLKRVNPSGRANVHVPVELRGEPVGLKSGGVLRQHLKTIEINCPDFRVPRSIPVRIGALEVGGKVLASAVTLPEHANLVTPGDQLVVEIYNPRDEA
jgi:large subunit ribosomal protein L25